MKSELATDAMLAARSGDNVGSRWMHRLGRALAGITRIECLAVFVLCAVWFGLAFLYNLQSFQSHPWRPSDFVYNFVMQQLFGFLLLVAVRVVEQGSAEPRRRDYLVALGYVVLITAIVRAGVLAGLEVPSKHSHGLRGLVALESKLIPFDVVEGGLVLLIYVHLKQSRRASKRLADAELERAERSRQLLSARLAAMQARVDPRFLFDALAHLETLYERDVDAAEAMLDHLIGYLRAALPQFRGEGSTLGRETGLAAAYLGVLRSRNGGGIECSVNVPVELAASAYPPMLVLPLVDGVLKGRTGDARIDIDARVVDGHLRVAATDAGGACDTSRASDPAFAALRDRIGQLFGESAGLRLDATPSRFTAMLETPHTSARADR